MDTATRDLSMFATLDGGVVGTVMARTPKDAERNTSGENLVFQVIAAETRCTLGRTDRKEEVWGDK